MIFIFKNPKINLCIHGYLLKMVQLELHNVQSVFFVQLELLQHAQKWFFNVKK